MMAGTPSMFTRLSVSLSLGWVFVSCWSGAPGEVEEEQGGGCRGRRGAEEGPLSSCEAQHFRFQFFKIKG